VVGFRPWAEKLGGRIVGDIKLFKIGNDKKLKELESREATLEKELQMLLRKTSKLFWVSLLSLRNTLPVQHTAEELIHLA